MSELRTYSENHIFTSRTDSQLVNLKSGKDETLNIDSLRNGEIFFTGTDFELQISPLGTVQNYSNTDTDQLQAQGSSVSVAENGTTSYIAMGCPEGVKLAPDSDGGVGPFQSLNYNTFVEQAALFFTVIQTGDTHNGLYSDIDEAGSTIIFSEANSALTGNSPITIFTRSGSVWSVLQTIEDAGHSVKISGDYFVTGFDDKNIDVYHKQAGVWSHFQNLISPTTSGVYDVIDIKSSLITVSTGTELQIFKLISDVWNKTQTISIASLIGISIFGSGNSAIIATCTSSDIYVYEVNTTSSDFEQTATFPITGITDICIGKKYIFVSNATVITSYYKLDNVWTVSGDTTADTGSTRIACSDNWLVIGKPTTGTFGSISVYPVLSDSDLIKTNRIKFSDIDLKIDSFFGDVIINDRVFDLSNFLSDDGTAALPSYSFLNDPNTGIFLSASDAIGFSTAGTERLTLNSTSLTSTLPIIIPLGTEALPSYTFVGDLDTGIYSPGANQLSITTAGTDSLTINSDGMVQTPKNPSFLAFNTVTDTSKTGDGTIFTIKFNSVLVDVNSDYNPVNGKFTAPITGNYSFSGAIDLGSLASNHTLVNIRLVTTARSYFLFFGNGATMRANTNELCIPYSTTSIPMTSGDTANITVTVSNGSKVVDINGGITIPATYFSGKLD